MKKEGRLFASLFLSLSCLLFPVFYPLSSSFAEEQITITTYYPAPYGIYRELRADQMAIGSVYRSSALSDGNLLVSGYVGIGDTTPAAPLTVGSGDLFQVDATGRARGSAASVSAPTFSFTGDTDTGMFRGGTNDLRFATAGTEALVINSSGNVGIGTASPASRLEVKPGTNSRLIVSNACPGGWCFTNPFSSSAEIGIFSRNDTNSGVPMNFQASEFTFLGGYLGIGTASPQAQLDVIGNALIRYASGSNNYILLGSADPNIGVELRSGSSGGTPYLDFSNDSSSDYDMRLILKGNDLLEIEGGGTVRIIDTTTTSVHTALDITNTNTQSNSWRLINAFSSNGGDSEFIVYGNGNVTRDGSESTPADYAEYFYSEDDTLKPGELVCLAGTNKIKRCDKDEILIGVVSTAPGIVGIYAEDITDAAEEYEKNPHWVKVGLMGQIPTKVSIAGGHIRTGDRLTAGEKGVAVKGESPRTLLIIALEDANQAGVIRALIK